MKHASPHLLRHYSYDSLVREQARHPSLCEWIKEMYSVYTRKTYSATKKNEIMFARKRMEQRLMLCERSQIRKTNSTHFLSHLETRLF
jgi:hypothetical protein